MFRGHRRAEVLRGERHVRAELLEVAWSHSMLRGHHRSKPLLAKPAHLLVGHSPVAHGFTPMHASHFFVFHVFAKMHTLLLELFRALLATLAGRGALLDKVGLRRYRSDY